MKRVRSWTDAERSASRLRVAFDGSALSLTVGAEEELMLVHPATGALDDRVDEVLARMGGDDCFAQEFRAAQVELVTRPYLTAADVGRELAVSRLQLAAAGLDGALLACGTHPGAGPLGAVTRGERYETIARDNPWAARHMLTCGLHVHVALAGADRALAVYNALRSFLPELAALSANSPYHQGVDTGLASTRAQLNRSLARHGVPPAFPDWDAYAEFTAWGRAGRAIPDASYHWWDLRLHPGYGTLEIRVCDTQTDVADTVVLVALAQTLVAWLAGRYDAGERLPIHDGHRIVESLWLAARADEPPALLDLDTGIRRPAADRVSEIVAALAPTARELGTEAELASVPALASSRGADRQKDVVSECGLDRLVGWLVDETARSARAYFERTTADAAPDGDVALWAGTSR